MKANMAKAKMGSEKATFNDSQIIGECSGCPAIVTQREYAVSPNIFQNWHQWEGEAYCPACAASMGIGRASVAQALQDDPDPFCMAEGRQGN